MWTWLREGESTAQNFARLIVKDPFLIHPWIMEVSACGGDSGGLICLIEVERTTQANAGLITQPFLLKIMSFIISQTQHRLHIMFLMYHIGLNLPAIVAQSGAIFTTGCFKTPCRVSWYGEEGWKEAAWGLHPKLCSFTTTTSIRLSTPLSRNT